MKIKNEIHYCHMKFEKEGSKKRKLKVNENYNK